MGRIERDESGTSGVTSFVKPSFVLVGAPDTNKEKIADTLARDFFTEKLAVAGGTLPAHFATGLLADYRVENLLMSQRATMLHSTDRATLYTHSLIDSLAYSVLRVDNHVQNQNVSMRHVENWALTMGLAGSMLRDTFKADEVFYVMADFEPDSDNAVIQDALGFVLDGYEMNYTIIDGNTEQAIDDIANVIRRYVS